MIRLNTKNLPCMKKVDIIYIFVVLLLSTSLLSSNTMAGTEKGAKVSGKMPETASLPKSMPGKLRGKIAPDFILNSITGEKYKLSNTRGKVVLIDFWHTY